jgi:hypothetical protein
LGGEQWIVAPRKGENEGGKNRDNKIVMMRLIIQKKRWIQKQQKVYCAWHMFWTFSFGIQSWYGTWYFGLCGEGC